MAYSNNSRYASKRGLVAAVSGKGTTYQRRNNLGQWTSEIERAVYALNTEYARNMQGRVVQQMTSKSDYRRPSVSTGRLAKATASERNRFSDRLGWGVGAENYLDRSIAKYWRTVEEGSAKTWREPMQGRTIYGLWGSNIVGYAYQARSYSAGSPTYQPIVNGSAKIPGKLNGWTYEKAQEIAKKTGRTYLGWGMVVKREAPAHNYYTRAWEQGEIPRNWGGRAKKILQRAVARELTGGFPARGF